MSLSLKVIPLLAQSSSATGSWQAPNGWQRRKWLSLHFTSSMVPRSKYRLKKHLMESTWLKLSASYCNPSTVSGSIPGKKVEQKWVILKILLIYIYLGFLEIAVCRPLQNLLVFCRFYFKSYCLTVFLIFLNSIKVSLLLPTVDRREF